MAPRGLQDGPRWAPRRSFRSSRGSKVMRPFSYTNGRITFGPTRHPSPEQIKPKQRKTRRVSWFSWFFLVASKGLPRRPQERPESGPERPQEAHFRALTGLSIIRITPSLIDCPKRALKASKRAPRAPQERPKRAPREPQESPRGFQNDPMRPPKTSKKVPRTPQEPKTVPRELQEGPTGLQHRPKRAP